MPAIELRLGGTPNIKHDKLKYDNENYTEQLHKKNHKSSLIFQEPTPGRLPRATQNTETTPYQSVQLSYPPDFTIHGERVDVKLAVDIVSHSNIREIHILTWGDVAQILPKKLTENLLNFIPGISQAWELIRHSRTPSPVTIQAYGIQLRATAQYSVFSDEYASLQIFLPARKILFVTTPEVEIHMAVSCTRKDNFTVKLSLSGKLGSRANALKAELLKAVEVISDYN